jgi:hypothetical protein
LNQLAEKKDYSIKEKTDPLAKQKQQYKQEFNKVKLAMIEQSEIDKTMIAVTG